MGADKVEAYERSGGRDANTLEGTDMPVIIITMRGNKLARFARLPSCVCGTRGVRTRGIARWGAPEPGLGTTTSRPTPTRSRSRTARSLSRSRSGR